MAAAAGTAATTATVRAARAPSVRRSGAIPAAGRRAGAITGRAAASAGIATVRTSGAVSAAAAVGRAGAITGHAAASAGIATVGRSGAVSAAAVGRAGAITRLRTGTSQNGSTGLRRCLRTGPHSCPAGPRERRADPGWSPLQTRRSAASCRLPRDCPGPPRIGHRVEIGQDWPRFIPPAEAPRSAALAPAPP